MRRLGSIILPIAEKHRVPAGEALAVDREPFAREVTETVAAHPNITVIHDEVCDIPGDRPLIIATGPLTSEALADHLKELAGESLYFDDAVAPTVTLDSLDLTKVFRASRRGRGSGLETGYNDVENPQSAIPNPQSEDYLNCPFTKDEYLAFWQELAKAEASIPHNPEDEKVIYFEMCMPVEEIARRGERTLAFGPMRPIGLMDPRTGKRPYAVVQLRQDNKEGTLWGLLGSQRRLNCAEPSRHSPILP